MSKMAEDTHAGWGARKELNSAFSVFLSSDMEATFSLRGRGLGNAILEPMSMTVFRSLYSVNYGLEFNLYIHIKDKAW